MKHRHPLACLVLCAVVVLAACDRRDTHPPEESRTTTDQVSPPGVQAGHVTAPAPNSAERDGRAGQDRCAGLTGDALQECTQRDGGVPMILTDDDAVDRPDDPRQPAEDAPAPGNPTSDQDGNLQ